MSKRSALDTLQLLAKRETDSAARQLSAAIEQHGSARQKLQMLVELRTEYVERLQQQSSQGMSIASIMNFQAFIAKIDDAIAGQQRLEASAGTRVEQANSGWQTKKRAEKTWESLIQRGDRAAALKALKQERKLMDEFASRATRHKIDGDAAD